MLVNDGKSVDQTMAFIQRADQEEYVGRKRKLGNEN